MIINGRPPLHFQGLTGAQLLRTPMLPEVTTAVKMTAEHGLIGALFGPAGTGKTFTAHTAANAVGVRACRVDFFGTTTPKEIASVLLEELAGDTDAGNERLLRRRLLEHLNANKTLIVLDEAQRLTITQLEYMRALHDRACELAAYEGGSTFGLLLVGGNGCAERIANYPMLRSRVSSWHKLEPLNDKQVVLLIPTYHPIYHGADPVKLLQIDDECAHGNLRHWARFTLHATAVAEKLGHTTLTDEVIAIALTLFRGGNT